MLKYFSVPLYELYAGTRERLSSMYRAFIKHCEYTLSFVVRNTVRVDE